MRTVGAPKPFQVRYRLSITMRRLGLFLLPAFFLASALHAQSAPSPDGPPPTVAPSPEDAQPDQSVTTIRVNSNLVSFFFTAYDKRGALIPDLTKNDCQVLEDKKPQKISNFTAEVNQPLTLGILLDTSGSQQNVLPLEQQSGSQFLRQILEKKDEAFLISFDIEVNLLEDYSNNAGELSRAMNTAVINTGAGGGAIGVPGLGQGTIPTQGVPKGTLLYDAVVLASHDKLSTETGRKALILLTDGEDEGSKYRVQDAIAAAQRANAIVYVILLADHNFYNGGNIMLGGYTGAEQMRRLTDATGGRVINVGNNGKRLEQAFNEIQDELRTQYLVSYVPLNKDFDGRYRAVSVECSQAGKKINIQARKGYYAVVADDSSSE
jgi:VWFA-related protein